MCNLSIEFVKIPATVPDVEPWESDVIHNLREENARLRMELLNARKACGCKTDINEYFDNRRPPV